ncbi:dUTP diphosphatase [uncultured Amnibacterium sp.]|uniref:dUTP diphosphatase n=1 Tax=uncultured Amnibacterium sp. TaxID=1631851 RepID=UPI0035CB698B
MEVLVDGPEPERAIPGDAAADLRAAEAVTLLPQARATVGTGLRIALPAGTAALVLPRSGLAAKHGITIVNAPGLIDAGYRGEIRVTLLNTDAVTSYDVAVGDRIAQLLVLPLPEVRFVPVVRLPGSQRAERGFGSTGRGEHPAGRPSGDEPMRQPGGEQPTAGMEAQ